MKVTCKVILYLFIGLIIHGCRIGSADSSVSFEQYKVADGFELQLVASEPLIESPVAMEFDNKGRIWVVEMRGFMPNIAGTGEDVPNGRISILDEVDKHGAARSSKVFLDSLVLPRAIALVYGGVLYAEPPNLWFVEIENDKPGKRVLVDSLYADEYSNPENQANGLMMGIDNWIYSAYSTTRYRLKDGKWIHEPTSFRGQFGITKDNFGRLYYNYNELQIAGDYTLPNTLIYNPYMKPKEALNRALTENQNVYPLHPTTVNRGYVNGILNKDSILMKFTAACGPLIYRGDQFPAGYSENAFVCEPEANLVKRNLLTFTGLETTARQAWDDREFIASTDEGFRPVNLANAPDGAMYVVDMHHGVMQHIVSATPYYKNSIVQKELDTIINAGRILRVKNKDKSLHKVPDLENTSESDLVNLLKSDNGWIRDRAQQILIYRRARHVIPELKKLVEEEKNTISAIHALRTLEGLNAVSFPFLQKVAAYGNPMLTAHALLLMEEYSTLSSVQPMKELVMNLMAKKDTVIDLYLAISLRSWIEISPDTFLPVLRKLSDTYSKNMVYQEAVVSSLKERNEEFRSLISHSDNDKPEDSILNKLLSQAINNEQKGEINPIFVQRKIPIPGLQKGLVIYRSTCSGCHGPDGEGIPHIAPPLKGSQFVSGSVDRLGMIILNGLEGPIYISGQLYEFNGAMPAFRDIHTDEEIAGIIDYLHNAFVAADPKLSYGRKRVRPEEIKLLRDKRNTILNEEDLLKMSDSEN